MEKKKGRKDTHLSTSVEESCSIVYKSCRRDECVFWFLGVEGIRWGVGARVGEEGGGIQLEAFNGILRSPLHPGTGIFPVEIISTRAGWLIKAVEAAVVQYCSR